MFWKANESRVVHSRPRPLLLRILCVTQILTVALILWYAVERSLDEQNLRAYEWQVDGFYRAVKLRPDFQDLNTEGGLRPARCATGQPKQYAIPAPRRSTESLMSVTILVKTGPTYFERRELTRKLWFNRCRSRHFVPDGPKADEHMDVLKNVRTLCQFYTGQSESADVMTRLRAEVESKEDVFVAPIMDGYDTMTSKTLWALHWYQLQQPTSDYLMLVDDDAYVVFENLLVWLMQQPRKRLYTGSPHPEQNRDVVRCALYSRSKNCINDNHMAVIKDKTYPPFASGFSYIVSRDIAIHAVRQALTQASSALPGNVEDAMLGFLLHKAGASLTRAPGFLHWKLMHGKCSRSTPLLVVGNVPMTTLMKMARNERLGKNPCYGLFLEPW
ncbi:uncharacterized protein LOC135805264 [Sycon ciliatum]|uniref:uncharacterized protein LOC135805264 n=1 Tax=Sycon ciliatum TaxID=27933 RepID=UPI0031F6E18D